MGIYQGTPGTNYAAVPGKLGTQVFPALDEIPLIGLYNKGLVNHWQAEDKTAPSGIGQWIDRIGGQIAAATSSGTTPATTADSGKAALNFNLGPFMRIPTTVQKTAAFTWVFIVKPTTLPAQQALLGADGLATGLRTWIKSDGSVRALCNGTDTISSLGKVVAGQRSIIAVSFSGTQMGFSFNGVFDKYVACTTPPVQESLAGFGSHDSLGSAGNQLNALVFDILQFDRDMLAAANTAAWATTVGFFKNYYGIA